MKRIDQIRQMKPEDLADILIQECNDDTFWWEDGDPVVVYRKNYYTPFAEFPITWNYERVKKKVMEWLNEPV